MELGEPGLKRFIVVITLTQTKLLGDRVSQRAEELMLFP